MREYLALPESYENLSKESTSYDLFGVIVSKYKHYS
jgi:hypothetical protein